jgi:dihydroorotate dehydrogenase
MIYKKLVKPLLFLLEPERAHHFVTFMLKVLFKIPGFSVLVKFMYAIESKKLERNLFGIKFPTPVGLAAGFDKDARLFNELSCFGFGFIEIGTVTPLPQPGNDKPRMFRLPVDEALINRMGFNNEGVEATVKRLKKKNRKLIIGGNIGKNKATPNEQAMLDYEKCFKALYDVVDYFVVNVSSPNTPGLRELQEKAPLTRILSRLQELNDSLAGNKSIRKPILLKVAPDLSVNQLNDIVEIVIETRLDGVVATNTTISREGLKTSVDILKGVGSGGLSGKPIKDRSTEVISYLHKKSEGRFHIIGVGGIHSPEDAVEKLKAGASLVQVYTGFIYEGPGLIKRINKRLLNA